MQLAKLDKTHPNKCNTLAHTSSIQ